LRKSVEKRWLCPKYSQRNLQYILAPRKRACLASVPVADEAAGGGRANDGRRPFRRRRNEGRPCERHARPYRLHRAPRAHAPLLRAVLHSVPPLYLPFLSRRALCPVSRARGEASYYAYEYAYVPCEHGGVFGSSGSPPGLVGSALWRPNLLEGISPQRIWHQQAFPTRARLAIAGRCAALGYPPGLHPWSVDRVTKGSYNLGPPQHECGC
jgi:hypothetical protein